MKPALTFLLASVLLSLAPNSHAQPPTYYDTKDPIMGDYVGEWTNADGKKGQLRGQIRSLGSGTYDGFVLLLRGRNPVAALKVHSSKPVEGNAPALLTGTALNLKQKELLPKLDADLKIQAGKLTGSITGDLGASPVTALKVERHSPSLGAKPPEGAVVLFDGKDTSKWKAFPWKLTGDGAMVVGGGNITTVDKWKNYKLHVEFRTPFMPKALGQGRGNSGVYIQSVYEVQVLDSFGLYPLQINDCGSIYGVARASGNACLPPMEWQTYDITYSDGDPATKRQPSISIEHNGTKVIEEAQIPADLVGKGGGGGNPEGGSIMLQDHGNPVQFRNIWLLPTGPKS